MSNNWFDRLAKAAGGGVSRRDAIRGAIGGLLGAAGLGLAVGRARAAACDPLITNSPYYAGCGLKCQGAGYDPTLDPVGHSACVDACVACADPYYCPAGGQVSRNAGLVCSSTNADGEPVLVCCGTDPGDPVYRTCKAAAKKRYAGCEAFA